MSAKKVKAIPEGYHTLTPFLSFKDASKAIQFYQTAFGAELIDKNVSQDGRIMHAVIKIGNSHIMMADEFPEHNCGIFSPTTLKGTTTMFHLYVEDVDASFDRAVKAGAKVQMPVADMFWGDRYGQLEDPFGHLWSIATHQSDWTREQINEKAPECFKTNV